MSGALDLGPVRDRLASELAGIVLPEIRAGAAHVELKAGDVGGDVVTDVDRRIQARLEALLPTLVAGSRFVGEEDFEAIADPDRGALWIVDPLDGTLNFAAGLPFYGASVALLVDGTPALAMVLDGVNGTVYDALAGAGARRNGVAFRFDAARAAVSPIAVSSGTLAFDAGAPQIGLVAALRAISPRFRILGGQALQLCWAAEGRLRLNINRETKLWDDAAGWLIAREAGAGHELASRQPLFPLRAGSAAARGQSLFSLAGDPALVARFAELISASEGVA